MKTLIPGKILILCFVLLLPALHSCTVQKRLYRPGFYVQRTVPAIHTNSSQSLFVENNIDLQENSADNSSSPITSIVITEEPERAIKANSAEQPASAKSVNIPQASPHKQQVDQKKQKTEDLKFKLKKNRKHRADIRDYPGLIFMFILVLLALILAAIWMFAPSFAVAFYYIGYGVLILFGAAIAVIVLIGIIDILCWLFDFSSGGCAMYNN